MRVLIPLVGVGIDVMRDGLLTDSPRIIRPVLTAIDCRYNLSCGWVFSRFQLRVNQLTVQGDFKAATTTGDKCESFNICFEFAQQIVRQTDGSGQVVSSGAVFNS